MIKHLSIQDNPLFPELNVLVMVGGDEKYWSKFFADQDDHFHEAAIHGEVKLFKPDDHDGYCKFTQLYKDGWMGDVPCIIIHFPEATFDHAYAPDVFSSAIIGHECLHAAQFIMEHYEISYSEKEFFARIQQWLFKAIAEWVEEAFFQEDLTSATARHDTLTMLESIVEDAENGNGLHARQILERVIDTIKHIKQNDGK